MNKDLMISGGKMFVKYETVVQRLHGVREALIEEAH